MGSDDVVRRAAERLRRAGFEGQHACAVVTGTGLGSLVDHLSDRISLSYAAIDGFPNLSVTGHGGRLHRGLLAGRPVLVFEGRAHAYEMGDAATMRVPIAVAKALGVDVLLLTNASGSLNPEAGPGSLVMLTDHINLSGLNPLIGELSDARFLSMVNAYDASLRKVLQASARTSGITLHQGIYAWFSGPSFETPAEVRMARVLGADLVGMSTAPETILARFYGLRVAALSVVTNLAAGIDGGDPQHAETKAEAFRAADRIAKLVASFVAGLPHPAMTRENVE